MINVLKYRIFKSFLNIRYYSYKNVILKKRLKKKLIVFDSFNFYRGIVEKIKYNPTKNLFLTRVYDIDKKKHFYNLLTHNLAVGSFIFSNFQVKIFIGNRCCIKNIPTGILINSVEIRKTWLCLNKNVIAKTAGCFCQLIQKSEDKSIIKLPSGKYKKISSYNFATIGIISNLYFKYIVLGKAGRSRWLKKKPIVRGVAMNPIDHPHGGGEGKTSGNSRTPWGKKMKK